MSEQNESVNEGKKRRNVMRIAVWVLTAAVVIVSFCIISSRLISYNRLQKSIAEKKQEIESQKEQIEELQYWLDAPMDYDYVIKVAREKIGLHFPDEEIYYTDQQTDD